MSSEEEKADEGGGVTSAESYASLNPLGDGIDDSRTSSSYDLLGEAFGDAHAGSTNGQDAVSISDVANGGEIAAPSSNKSEPSEDRGKPPRPQGVQRRATSTDSSPTKHRKQLSAAEYSTLSALTDDGQEGVDLPTRNGKISWDLNVARDAQEEAELMFGETSRTKPSLRPPSPPISPLPPAGKGSQRWGTVRTTFLKKETVMIENPMASEAETAILRVLERTRKRDAAKAGNIMPHVPKATVSAFQASSANEEALADKSLDEASETKGSRRSVISAEQKRTKTLESKLLNLGAQMDRLQQDKEDCQGGREIHMSGDTRAGNERLLSRDKGRRGLLLSRDAPPEKGNSGDSLAKNAEILFRRPITKKDSFSLDTQEDIPTAPTMSVHIGDRKKTDGDDVIQEADALGTGSKESEYDIEAGGGDALQSSLSERRRKFGLSKAGKSAKSIVCRANDDMKEGFGYFWEFLKPRVRGIKLVLGITLFFVIIPAITIAAILFYSGNPDLGREGASASWLVLFLSRQAVTFLIAKATEAIIIDFLSLQLRLTVRLFGPMFTLLFVQSKGFPFMLFSWGVFNFCFNSGGNKFAQHWMFWQSLIRMFTVENSSGNITHSNLNYRINGTAIGVGLVIALKRLWWGLYLGKRSYLHYGDDLAKAVKNMVLVSEVANLGKEIEKHGDRMLKRKKMDPNESRKVFNGVFDSSHSLDDVGREHSVADDTSLSSEIGSDRVIDEERRNKFTGTLDYSQKLRLEELLGKWEEPETATEVETDVSIASILQFRQVLAFMDEDYPFTPAYGPADSRETCVESAQKLYQRLLGNSSNLDVGPFESMCTLALKKDGDIDSERMKDLIKLFRPDRQGNLTMLDFVKSCDTVYKEMRLLRASIANSGQIDHAFEIMLNVVFYVILAVIILAVLGLDPLALFISISGIVLAFAFMIGSASSKYFEGILFILVRRPYDIGDRINVAGVEESSSGDGCATWFVQNVDLFTTTVRYAFTNEVATIANGSLAASRIINAKRSPKANVYIYMKFSVNVPYQKLLVFKKTVEAFVKDRPREFEGMTGFRATHMANEKGYVEYVICLNHRESWQNIGSIVQSKANVSSFCLEVSKKLNMTYTAPPLPVNLSLAQPNMQLRVEPVSREGRIPDTFENASIQTDQTPSSPDFQSIAAMFDGGGGEEA